MSRYYKLQYRWTRRDPWVDFTGFPQRIHTKQLTLDWLAKKRQEDVEAEETEREWQGVIVKEEPLTEPERSGGTLLRLPQEPRSQSPD